MTYVFTDMVDEVLEKVMGNKDYDVKVSFTTGMTEVVDKEGYLIFSYHTHNCGQTKIFFELNSKFYRATHSKKDGFDIWTTKVGGTEETDITRKELMNAQEEFIKSL